MRCLGGRDQVTEEQLTRQFSSPVGLVRPEAQLAARMKSDVVAGVMSLVLSCLQVVDCRICPETRARGSFAFLEFSTVGK